MGIAVTLLCGLFALVGYLISDRTGIAVEATRDATRLSALEQQSSDYQKKFDVIIPSLARIEQSLADLKDTLGQSKGTHNHYSTDSPVASYPGIASDNAVKATPPINNPSNGNNNVTKSTHRFFRKHN
jgi:hypothetical protein